MAAEVTTLSPAAGRRVNVSVPLQVAGVLLFVLLIPVAFGMELRDFRPLFTEVTARFFFFGALATVLVSLVAIVASLPIATALALGRLSTVPFIRYPSIAFVEVVRSLPLLLLIFYINLRSPFLDVFEGVVASQGS